MILDSSALLAILRREPERAGYLELVDAAETCRMSAGNVLESEIVIDAGRSVLSSHFFDEFLNDAGIVVEPVTEEQVRIARQAYRDYGKGTGHPAQLNFGDCFAYALAKVRGEPLLFKGQDFARTDIMPADPHS